MAVAAGAFSFVGAYDEAHETQDDVLHQSGLVARHQRAALLDRRTPMLTRR
jgi:hypothetical protein